MPWKQRIGESHADFRSRVNKAKKDALNRRKQDPVVAEQLRLKALEHVKLYQRRTKDDPDLKLRRQATSRKKNKRRRADPEKRAKELAANRVYADRKAPAFIAWLTEHRSDCSTDGCDIKGNPALIERDHIDPIKKLFEMTLRNFTDQTAEAWEAEENKTRALCLHCHRRRTTVAAEPPNSYTATQLVKIQRKCCAYAHCLSIPLSTNPSAQQLGLFALDHILRTSKPTERRGVGLSVRIGVDDPVTLQMLCLHCHKFKTVLEQTLLSPTSAVINFLATFVPVQFKAWFEIQTKGFDWEALAVAYKQRQSIAIKAGIKVKQEEVEMEQRTSHVEPQPDESSGDQHLLTADSTILEEDTSDPCPTKRAKTATKVVRF